MVFRVWCRQYERSNQRLRIDYNDHLHHMDLYDFHLETRGIHGIDSQFGAKNWRTYVNMEFSAKTTDENSVVSENIRIYRFLCFLDFSVFSGYILLHWPGKQLSGSVPIYQQAHERVENISHKAAVLVLVIIIPLYTLPVIAVSYYQYYVGDAGESSFLLSFPATWVFISFFFVSISENKIDRHMHAKLWITSTFQISVQLA